MKRMARVASGFPGYKITWKSSTFEWFHTDDTFLRKVFFVEFNEMSMENVQWNGGTIFLRIFFSIQFWWWIESTFFCTSQLWTLARSNPSCSKFQQILFYSWNRIFIWTLWVHYFHKKVTLNSLETTILLFLSIFLFDIVWNVIFLLVKWCTALFHIFSILLS